MMRDQFRVRIAAHSRLSFPCDSESVTCHSDPPLAFVICRADGVVFAST
jgi:hypothetical protein